MQTITEFKLDKVGNSSHYPEHGKHLRIRINGKNYIACLYAVCAGGLGDDRLGRNVRRYRVRPALYCDFACGDSICGCTSQQLS
jgi:hypothetical protein